MTMTEYIKSIVTSKGWLAVENMYFDNTSLCRIPNTHGRVAIDKVNNMVYVVSSNDSLTTSSLLDRLVIFEGKDLSVINMITVYSLEYLQRVGLSTFAKYTYYKDNTDLPIPSIPSSGNIDSLILHDLKYTNGFNEHADIPLIKIYQSQDAYLNANEVTRFYRNQQKFKEFLVSYLGLLPENLL